MTLAGMPLLQLSKAGAAPASGAPQAVPGDKLYALFKEPAGLARPFVRWWWNGNRVTRQELLRELDMLKAAGIGGVEINPIEFPETAEPMGIKGLDWLSEEWLALLQAAIQGAKERGMTCDLIVGSGWPFGGEFLSPEEQTQMLALGTRNLKGPKHYEFTRQELLKEVEPPVMSKRKEKLKELILLRLSAARMEEFNPGLDLNSELQKDIIQIDVPEGEHVLYSLVKLTGFESVIHGAPGANGPVLNHYSKPAVEKYLNRMSDALDAKLGSMGPHLRSLFVDSMELEGANWCDDMPEQFARRRGYALAPYLPFILFKTGRMGRALDQVYGAKLSAAAQDMIERVRYDFEITRLELFRERFLETFLAWCRKHGVQSRVQAYGREYHPFDASLSVDIPECETWVRPETGKPLKDFEFKQGRSYSQVNKLVASAARLTGKRLVSCEELTNTQVVFNASLEKLKVVADLSNLSGVTHSILHGFNYSPKEAPFPGWVRYGTFFNERNPWWPYFSRLVDYKARLSAVFQNADPYADIALLHPLADLWSKYGVQWDPNPERAWPDYVFNVWEGLQQSGNACDYVSEQILQNATFSQGVMAYGPRRYKTLLLIEVESMQPQTAEALRRFADAGGRIVFIGKEPARAAGLAGHLQRDKLVQDTIAGIKRQHPDRVALCSAPDRNNQTVLEWVKDLQARFKLEPYLRIDHPVTSVSQVYYQCEDRDLFFFSNYNLTQAHEFEVAFTTKHKTAWLWDPETGERHPLPQSGHKLRIRLAPAESKLIVFDDQKAAGETAVLQLPKPAGAVTVSGPWTVQLEHVNGTRRSLTLDALVDFKDKDELKAFAGVLWYETTLQLADPREIEQVDLGKVCGVSEVVLNGQNLGVRWHGEHLYRVAGATRTGANLLRVKVTTTLGNYMKSLTGNKDGVKWMKNQPFHPMGLLGPVRLLSRGRR